MSRLERSGAIAALAVGAFLVAGCGETVIDDVKTEGALKQNLSSLGKEVKAVDCPEGVEVEAKATFECSVSLAGGREETASLQIVNEDADVEVVDLSPAK